MTPLTIILKLEGHSCTLITLPPTRIHYWLQREYIIGFNAAHVVTVTADRQIMNTVQPGELQLGLMIICSFITI